MLCLYSSHTTAQAANPNRSRLGARRSADVSSSHRHYMKTVEDASTATSPNTRTLLVQGRGGGGKMGGKKGKVDMEEEEEEDPPDITTESPVESPHPADFETPLPTTIIFTDAPVDGVDPTICAEDDIQTLSQSVIMNFIGRLEDLDEVQIASLQDSFLLAYNELSNALCPERSFSKVVQVQIDDEDKRRQLQLVPGLLLRPAKPFSFFAYITTQCNSCGNGNKGLFGNDAVDSNKEDETTRNMQTGLSQCAPCVQPTPDNFAVGYNAAIQDLIEQGALPAVESVLKVAELEAIPCAEEVALGDALLIIEVEGNLTDATQAESTALEKGIEQTFNALNGLNDETCDPFFRRIASVKSNLLVEGNRQLQLSPVSPLLDKFNLKNKSQISFNIVFKCRGCGKNENIFFTNDAPDRRNLASALSRDLQAEESCLCAIGAEELRAPTRDEFVVAFNNTVQVLIAQGEVRFISEVGAVAEIEEVTCPAASPVEENKTQIVIDVPSTNETTLLEEDIAVLGASITETFNKLNIPSLCDPNNRFVTDVEFIGFLEIVEDERRQLQLPLIFLKQTVKTLGFNIVYNCKQCNAGTGLFGNDASRRALSSLASSPSMPHRRLQENATCFCDVDITFSRAPTEDEFLQAFVVEVEDLQLASIKTILGVSEPEAPIDFPPTPSPMTDPVEEGQSISIESNFQVAFRNGQNGTYADDLKGAFDLLVPQVITETFPDLTRRRTLLEIYLSGSEVTLKVASKYLRLWAIIVRD